MNNNTKALKSGIWYTISNFLTKSVGFLVTPIFTRLLTHEEFGLYNNYASWLGILTIIVTLYLESTFISARFEFEKSFDEYIFSVLGLSTISALLWLLLVNCFKSQFSELMGLDNIYINCMLVYLIFLPAVHMFQARERYYFQYKMTVFISMLVTVGTAVVSVLFVLSFNDRLKGRILGSAAPTIIIGIVLYYVLFRRGKRINIDYWKYALPICIPYIPHLLSLTILNSVDRIMINRICGSADNALYSLAYTCGSIITILITSMNSAFAPWLGEKLHERKEHEIRDFANIYIFVFCVASIGIMLASPEVLMILGGKTYQAAVYVMPPITCGCVFQFMYTMFVNIEQFNKKTVGMAIASMTAALLNYILNAIYIPRFGYVAAAYTTLVGFLFLLLAHMFLVSRIGFGHVYNYKFVIVTAVTMIAVTAMVNWLYRVPIFRYSVVAFYLIVLSALVYRFRGYLVKFKNTLKK